MAVGRVDEQSLTSEEGAVMRTRTASLLLIGSLLMACAAEPAADRVTAAIEACGSTCTECVLNTRTDLIPFYQQRNWDTSCTGHDAIVADWCTNLDPGACNAVESTTCSSACGSPHCGTTCTQCILNNRTDILTNYRSFGWDVSCGHHDAVVNDWCTNLDTGACNGLRTGVCASSCGAPATCASDCTTCIIQSRPDVLQVYSQSGWNTSCSNWDAITDDWCGQLSVADCASVRHGTCAATCETATRFLHGISPFYGAPAVDPELWDERSFDKIVEAGATSTHVSFDWAVVQPQAGGALDWTRLDHQVSDARAHGLEPFAFMGNTPDWALPAALQHQNPPKGPVNPPDEALHGADFDNYVTQVANRFCSTVHYYEFWNEENGCGWTNGGCSNNNQAAANLYTKWLVRWAVRMRAACPTATLALGGLDCKISSDRTNAECVDHLERIYQAGGGGAFDAVSMHPYGSGASPALNFDAIQAMTNKLRAHGHGNRKLWLDEWGQEKGDPTRVAVVNSALAKLELPRFSNVFEARYIVLTDQPGGVWGMSDATPQTTMQITPRPSWQAFCTQGRGPACGTVIALQNGDMESETTAQFGRITGWGPNGGWQNHAGTARRNADRLGTRFGFYSAGTTETVGQITATRFAANRQYVFNGWVNGGGDQVGKVPFQIGYAATDGVLGSFTQLQSKVIEVNASWAEATGVRYRTKGAGPEIGKQIIVRLGNGAAGGASDIWFDSLSLTTAPAN